LPPPSKLHANRVGVAGGHPHDHVPEHEISKNVCDSRVDAGHAGVPPGGGKFVRHGIDGGLGQRLPVEPGAKVRVLEDHGERQGRLNCGDDDLVAGVRHPRCPSELGGGLRRRVDQCVDVYRGRSSDLSLAHGDGCTCGSSWQLTRSWLKGGAARAGSPDGGSRGIGRPRGREVGSHPHRLRSAGPPLRGGWGKPGLGSRRTGTWLLWPHGRMFVSVPRPPEWSAARWRPCGEGSARSESRQKDASGAGAAIESRPAARSPKARRRSMRQPSFIDAPGRPRSFHCTSRAAMEHPGSATP
jgi:hypothetical protein